MHSLLRLASAAVVLVALTACGGGSADSSASQGSTVQGVSTPSSVSVVTAKNAQ